MSGGRGRRRGGEQPMVPDATFTSYYGLPVINAPVWKAPNIAGYLFVGGLAGASSVVAAGADATGRPALGRASKVGAFGAISVGLVALVHDLGRPGRFVNMLRVFKPTSPMSLGSWVLAAYGPATAVAAGAAVTGRLPRLGRLATGGAAALGPLVASYTAALISDTAVPAWHEGYREMPFVFVGSGATAAAGLAMLAAPVDEAGPARTLAVLGAALELGAAKRMEQRLGKIGTVYSDGTSGRLMKAAQALTVAGTAGGLVFGRRSRRGAMLAGASLVTASALTRFGIFEAGMRSADDPAHTVEPQRARLTAAGSAAGTPAS